MLRRNDGDFRAGWLSQEQDTQLDFLIFIFS